MAFTVHEFEHVGTARDFGRVAADRPRLDPDQVFKTLVVAADGALGRGDRAGEPPAVAEGDGDRPRGQASRARRPVPLPSAPPATSSAGSARSGNARRLPTVIDETCELFDTIYVSGGRRGLDLGVAPGDLVAVTGAVVAAITA